MDPALLPAPLGLASGQSELGPRGARQKGRAVEPKGGAAGRAETRLTPFGIRLYGIVRDP